MILTLLFRGELPTDNTRENRLERRPNLSINLESVPLVLSPESTAFPSTPRLRPIKRSRESYQESQRCNIRNGGGSATKRKLRGNEADNQTTSGSDTDVASIESGSSVRPISPF